MCPSRPDKPRKNKPAELKLNFDPYPETPFKLSSQEEKLVITTTGLVQLGELLAQCYLGHR